MPTMATTSHGRHQNPTADAHDCGANGERHGGREHGVGDAAFGQPEIEADRNGGGAGRAPGKASPKLQREGRIAPDGCQGEERQRRPPSIRTVLAHEMLLSAPCPPPPEIATLTVRAEPNLNAQADCNKRLHQGWCPATPGGGRGSTEGGGLQDDLTGAENGPQLEVSRVKRPAPLFDAILGARSTVMSLPPRERRHCETGMNPTPAARHKLRHEAAE